MKNVSLSPPASSSYYLTAGIYLSIICLMLINPKVAQAQYTEWIGEGGGFYHETSDYLFSPNNFKNFTISPNGSVYAISPDNQIITWGNQHFSAGVPAMHLGDIQKIQAAPRIAGILNAENEAVIWNSNPNIPPRRFTDVKDFFIQSNFISILNNTDGSLNIQVEGETRYDVGLLSELDGISSIDYGTYSFAAIGRDGRATLWASEEEGVQADTDTLIEQSDSLVKLKTSSYFVRATHAHKVYYLGLRSNGDLISSTYDTLAIPEMLRHGVADFKVNGITLLIQKEDGAIYQFPAETPEGFEELTATYAISSLKQIHSSYNYGILEDNGQLHILSATLGSAYHVPKNLTSFDKLIAGVHASIAIGPEGKAHVWGEGQDSFWTPLEGMEQVEDVILSNHFDGNIMVVIHKDGSAKSVVKPLENRLIWGVGGVRDSLYTAAEMQTWIDTLSLPTDIQDPKKVRVGIQHGIALMQDGSLRTWGMGAKINGSEIDPLSTPEDLKAIDIGATGYGSFVVREDGTVAVFGGNPMGSLTQIPEGLNQVVALDVGLVNVAALKANGTVVVWGANNYGQCNVPAHVKDIVDVQVGNGKILARNAKGELFMWGDGGTARTNPYPIKGLTHLAASSTHFFAWGASIPPIPHFKSASGTLKDSLEVSLSFNKEVMGLEKQDFRLENAELLELSSSNNTAFSLQLKALKEGDVSIWLEGGTYTDTQGALGTPSDTLKIRYDATPPTVAFSTEGNFNTSPVIISMATSEPISYPGQEAFSVVNATIANIGYVNDSLYTIELAPQSPSDSIYVSTDLGNPFPIQDLIGNVIAEVASIGFIYDSEPPTALLQANTGSKTDRDTFQIEIAFNEPVVGFDSSDIIMENLQIVSLDTQDSTVFQAMVMPVESGNISCYIPEGIAHDFAANLNLASEPLMIEYIPNSNRISGRVYEENGDNCTFDEGVDRPLEGYVVKASPSGFHALSKADGTYELIVDKGEYQVETVINRTVGRLVSYSCDSVYQVQFDTLYEVATDKDFRIKVVECPVLSVKVSSNRRRRCFENYTTLAYENAGFNTAEDAKVHLRLPEYVHLLRASEAFTLTADSIYVFDIGSLEAGASGSITVVDSVACIEGIRGLDQCTEAWITPANSCLADNTPADPNWSRASLAIEGFCRSNSQGPQFIIYNNGEGDMAQPSTYRIYQDTLLFSSDEFQLMAGDSLVIRTEPFEGSVRMEADQVEGHPGNSFPQHTIQGCGGGAVARISSANVFVQDDAMPETAIDCMEIIDSYDPNDKTATPRGLTEHRFVKPNTPIDYRIRFQNTGTDTAYTVVVVDTLSNLWDLSTFEMGAVSHPYELTLSGEENPVLTFTFNDIDLVDSTTNEPKSHGYIKFQIAPIGGLPDNTIVHNFADIYFDFNLPIRTNDAFINYYDTVFATPAYEFGVDLDLPSATLLEVDSFVNAPFEVGVQLSEESVFESTAFSLSNATVSDISGGNLEYMATIAPVEEGEVGIYIAPETFADLAGNPNIASNFRNTIYDITPPAITWGFEADVETLEPIAVNISFSERVVGTLTLDDFEVSGGIAGNLTPVESGYRLAITPSDIGTVAISLKAGVVSDRAGNLNEQAEGALAITNIADEQLAAFTKVYPNPSAGRFMLELGWGLGKHKHIQVWNALGKLVDTHISSQERIHLDLSGHPSGQYMLQITAGDQVVLKKVIVE